MDNASGVLFIFSCLAQICSFNFLFNAVENIPVSLSFTVLLACLLFSGVTIILLKGYYIAFKFACLFVCFTGLCIGLHIAKLYYIKEI